MDVIDKSTDQPVNEGVDAADDGIGYVDESGNPSSVDTVLFIAWPAFDRQLDDLILQADRIEALDLLERIRRNIEFTEMHTGVVPEISRLVRAMVKINARFKPGDTGGDTCDEFRKLRESAGHHRKLFVNLLKLMELPGSSDEIVKQMLSTSLGVMDVLSNILVDENRAIAVADGTLQGRQEIDRATKELPQVSRKYLRDAAQAFIDAYDGDETTLPEGETMLRCQSAFREIDMINGVGGGEVSAIASAGNGKVLFFALRTAEAISRNNGDEFLDKAKILNNLLSAPASDGGDQKLPQQQSNWEAVASYVDQRLEDCKQQYDKCQELRNRKMRFFPETRRMGEALRMHYYVLWLVGDAIVRRRLAGVANERAENSIAIISAIERCLEDGVILWGQIKIVMEAIGGLDIVSKPGDNEAAISQLKRMAAYMRWRKLRKMMEGEGERDPETSSG
ncbi:hypothetical protein HYW82_04480 [Candidatus Peregrinibacteria bacterium]|nr:hypothetical protein [Candidatus Peregrinibacteria bacterium]